MALHSSHLYVIFLQVSQQHIFFILPNSDRTVVFQGNDQWWTKNRSSLHANTQRLTSDLAIVSDDVYRAVAAEYAKDHDKFDSDFADAWHKLVHRSADHPHQDDLEKDIGICTEFEFLN